MILVDLNQVLLAGLMAQIANDKKTKVEESLVRHMSLNILRMHVKNFRNEYGEVVLACDNRKYWRKELFPYYKAGRKKTRAKSDLDWHLIFDILAKIKEELKKNFPYKVLDVEGAEADDIIATLVKHKINEQNILILSSDGDFLQLQKYNRPNQSNKVKQYNPAQKKYLISDNPLKDLKEKIISGDKGDGIPNILSASDCFVTETRQTPITKGKMQKFLSEPYDDWEDDKSRIGFSRNQALIDLSFIPEDIEQKIINSYVEAKPANKQKLLNYFIQYKLRNLMDVIEDF
jgi:5'-3' exonuclease, N-terminal resolvase-like domain/T4 RNase H, C terminal